MNTFETLQELADSGYVFRIQDNGGATADRYTVVTSDGDYLSLSAYPTHPQGISQSGEDIDLQGLQAGHEEGREIDMSLGDLPSHVADHVLYRINQSLSDYLQAVDQGLPHAVAPSRKIATPNEGLSSSGGDGIYRIAEGFMVRRDSDMDQDFGPYESPRVALIATLPSDYSLSGPEYQSSVTVSRLEASPEVAAAIATLEAEVEMASQMERSLSL